MRILHIDSGETLRGGQLQVLRLLSGLEARNVEVRLMAVANSPLEREAASRGFETRRLSWISLWRESRWADLVHCHDAHAHTFAWLGSHAPYVVSRRVAFSIKKSWFSTQKYASARLFLCVSKAVAEVLHAAGIPEERLQVVYDGVDLPPEIGNRRGKIAALDSEDPGKCRAMLEQLPLDIDFVTDLPRAFQSARMFLYPTASEGLGSAALLAMAYGVPVIASDTGGLREIVQDHRTGLLAGNTVRQFQDAVYELEGDPKLTERIVRNARAMVLQGFTTQHMVGRTIECYREALR
ncbi:MAG: glycosyltransferase family 4 protein [Bryobacteraceae bacterium]|nr:glycosyltransferase family 4 protein [Bryobacteraceae bacterium]